MKLKSIVTSEQFTILVPLEGQPIRLAGRDLLSTDDILKMSNEILEQGWAELTLGESSKKNLGSLLELLDIEYAVEPTGSVTAKIEGNEVPNVEKLSEHISQAEDQGYSQGIKKLIERMSKIDRKHSVNDLMDFLQHSCLPITIDGDILAYKRLSRFAEGNLFDTHTNSVPQKVGTYVCVPDGYVDDRRNVSCSQGLHIGNRDYVRGFVGNTVVVALVKPEDVITVPTDYSSGKVRAKGYQIVYELTPAQVDKFNNHTLSNEEILGHTLDNLVSGIFPPANERVMITKPNGREIEITKLEPYAIKVPKTKVTGVTSVTTPKDKQGPEEDKKIDISKLNAATSSVGKQLRSYYNTFAKHKNVDNYMALLLIKRKQKKSWGKLGFSEEECKVLDKFHKNNSDIIKGR